MIKTTTVKTDPLSSVSILAHFPKARELSNFGTAAKNDGTKNPPGHSVESKVRMCNILLGHYGIVAAPPSNVIRPVPLSDGTSHSQGIFILVSELWI
jgi:hypothetical protein